MLGRARIGGRTVVVQGDDFTVRGGAADAAIWQKQVIAEQMARELRCPSSALIGGTGGGGSVKSLDVDGRTYVPANLAGTMWSPIWRRCRSSPSLSARVAGLGARAPSPRIIR